VILNYIRPTLVTLLTRIQSDLAFLPAVLRVPLAKMLARMVNGLHGHLDWVNAQTSPLTCELERLYDFAALYSVDRLLARAAVGKALATGNVGATLLADKLLRGSNGLDYIVLAAVTLGAGNTEVSIRCTTKGVDGNLAAGATLTLVDPANGVNSVLTVGAQGITGGDADEAVDAWRLRVCDEWQTVVKHGGRSGKVDDYRFWAKSATTSVTTAIVQPHGLGIGTMVVRPICNGLANRMPTQGVMDAVMAKMLIDAPGTADWRVTFPIAHPHTLNIHLIPAVDTQAHRDTIASALNALWLTKDNSTAEKSQMLWAEIDAVVGITTQQYVLDETVSLAWSGSEVPVLQPINWI
jgi:uncharacterized phage protein gp47/JayE